MDEASADICLSDHARYCGISKGVKTEEMNCSGWRTYVRKYTQIVGFNAQTRHVVPCKYRAPTACYEVVNLKTDLEHTISEDTSGNAESFPMLDCW